MRTLTAYRTPPQMEQKAAREARDAGHRAYVPTEKIGARRVPTARGYVFADGKPTAAKNIRSAIGQLQRHEIIGLYLRTSKTQRRHAFAPGDRVHVKRGNTADVPGEVVKIVRVGWYQLALDMMGKRCLVKVHESALTKIREYGNT